MYCGKISGTPDMVIKNAVIAEGAKRFQTDIEITGDRISAVGKSAFGRQCMTVNAEGFIVTAGRTYICRDIAAFDAEKLLFSGYSTVIFESVAGGLPVSEYIKAALQTPLNFAVAASSSAPCMFYPGEHENEGALPDTDILNEHIGAAEVGRLADLFFWLPDEAGAEPVKIIKSGKLIFDRTLSSRRDIIYAMTEPERSVFFTSRSAAEGYIGMGVEPERAICAVI